MKRIYKTVLVMFIFSFLAAGYKKAGNVRMVYAGDDANGSEVTKTFKDIRHVVLLGYSHNIEVRQGDTENVVITWPGDSESTLEYDSKSLELSMVKEETSGSAIRVELPVTIDTVTIDTSDGSIEIDNINYNKLVAKTREGDVTASGVSGEVVLETPLGEICSDLIDVTELERGAYALYNASNSKDTFTNTFLFTEEGAITIE